MRSKNNILVLSVGLIISALACDLLSNVPVSGPSVASETPSLAPLPSETPGETLLMETPTPSPTETLTVAHVNTPSESPTTGTLIYDVDSSVTGAEKRAPYGDSYDINRLERPFLQDMTYVSDLDIQTFNLGVDADWYYVSLSLAGVDPNNALGINYGVELDTNADGFGDYIMWAHPPYTSAWSTDNVQVFADKNHDTSGLSADKSDAPITTDGYETLIFDGGRGSGDDPDLAWVRINAGSDATVQFAFKKPWAGTSFMFGGMADGGLKDVSKLDYVDRFTEPEAGSPVKDKKYYPLGALFAVDNTCREAFGFHPNGYEPMLCPRDQPKPTKKPGVPPPVETLVPTIQGPN